MRIEIDEVGVGRPYSESEIVHCVDQDPSCGLVALKCEFLELIVVKRGFSSVETYSVAAESGGVAHEVLNDFLVGHQVSHSHSCHAVELGECSDYDQVGIIGDGVYHCAVAVVLDKVDISFVYYEEYVLRQLLLELMELVRIDQCSCRVVRVAQEDDLGLVCDGIEDALEVRCICLFEHRHLDQLAALSLDVVVVVRICRRCEDDLISIQHEYFGNELKTCSSALCYHYLICGESVKLGQLLSQSLSADVRISVRDLALFLHGFYCHWRYAERVLVGCQLEYSCYLRSDLFILLVCTYDIRWSLFYKFTYKIFARHNLPPWLYAHAPRGDTSYLYQN